MKRLFTRAVVLSLLLAGCSTPTVTHVRVVDTDNVPVASAKVTVGWSWYKMRDWGNLNARPQTESKNGITDQKGEVTFFGLTKGKVGAIASKEDYYSGRADNPEKIVLRKKGNPSPMYAKRACVDLPAGDGEFGYDLFAGDLIAPFGTGAHSDVILKVSTTNSNWRERVFKHLRAEILFPSPDDGIQTVFIPTFGVSPSSNYRLPFVAPESGYQHSLNEANGNTEMLYTEYRQQPQIRKPEGQWPPGWHKDDSKLPPRWYWVDTYDTPLGRERIWADEVNYFFKIRSDTNGRACYGIIRGIFRPDYRGDNIPHIEFEYYVNPDGTRNIEFDPAKNLMKRNPRNRLENITDLPY